VRVVELLIAVVLTGLGIRSMLVWARRPFASTALVDQVLYALYRTGRVGLWFAFAGLFWVFAFAQGTSADGQRYTRDISGYAWFVVLFAALAVMQLIGGWFLGHRQPAPD
jgi:hypothetical protein